jgi:hypothetical protein
MLRHSSLFRFRNGNHACVFYRSEDSLLELLTPYIAEGLQQGERCFCAQKPAILKRLLSDLRILGIDAEKEIHRGALQLHTEDEAYFPSKKFEPAAMIDMLLRSINESQQQGYAAFRSAGELSWAVRGWDVCDRVIEYEKVVEEIFPSRPAIGLCQYSVEDFPPGVLDAVLATHTMHFDESRENTQHSSFYVNYQQYGVEVVADKSALDPHYYYVAQRRQPPELMGWGVASDFNSAIARTDSLAHAEGTQA